MKKAAFYTLGCKVNQYETEAMTESFENAGYEIVDYSEFADVYIINTCTVTNMGDRKSRQIIRRAREKNPEALVAVVGCYSQIAPGEVLEIPEVSLVVGTDERSRMVELVEYAMEKEEKLNMVNDIMKVKEFEEMSIKSYKSRTRAFLKIQEGCDQYCTYCIIPYARGHIRSRKPDSIIAEVKELAENGFREIVLTGIHVASYGKDLGNTSLIDIIEKVHEIDGIRRIRMSSVDPNVMTDGFIERLSRLPKICGHFHLSLQSGCDETLKRMNRKYTTGEYRRVVKKLREVFADVAITTDLIVGFPGETEEEFQKTVDFVEEIAFSAMHVFKYSQRTGTPAAKYENQIKPQVKDSRSKVITAIAQKNEEKFKKAFIGRSKPVLYEQPFDGQKSLFEGLTDNYIRVVSESREDIKGKIIETVLAELKEDYMTGRIY
ncbi:MAG TPA: tRNA (N(6)-L-threonylcarbamoyladenosine(37)-C(2))-methylthiotransferase MtaB [Bacillota bacterium]|nr:tRNA (N(6)-L-threonylcarbamoyladenosine(37)-C(2))-methylthiotransferase MtaB [Bacillota bacterium]HPA55020.1 tRNA (N(6)-L-threonylcarbamoyladenosine(37)-C(2))-methylthiotransferase MtaB [Bacillota bacterium]HPX69937.1 tRNA (N(6)-L-threonylcarbamoyladenosine(37)-C(2))-methylthiotransferase MtaB [Bacillota bacterium]HQO42879.1 tRNA (N(6)-L-threonylcarbamoyladenosine(37)-C(2))-methylthiotransferase MtaB [Bacillota bacterium]HQQ44500.1 tRNA (N(6)-L-threonylcarbamoyladenosine(37)-C(2))-methylthio